MDIKRCDICGQLLSIEEAEKNRVDGGIEGFFYFCNRHMRLLEVLERRIKRLG